ncbi:MAG: acetylxylan esterase [Bacteroidales bacterium]|nr:acetylxylan esterase [Bacteroidales bacterium]MCF8390732.1 acetylxylan esterase [Bacteroidales bacterium]
MKRPVLFILLTLSLSAFSQIPENLTPFFKTGSEHSIEEWEETIRPAIIKTFCDEVYGNIPEGFKPEISFKVEEEKHNVLNGTACRKQVVIILETEEGKSLEMGLLIYLPENQKEKIPVFLGLNFYGNHTISTDPEIFIHNSWSKNSLEMGVTENKAIGFSRGKSAHRWPLEKIIARGYGVATVYYGDIDPDFDDGFRNGLHGLIYNDENNRSPLTDAGSIAAWAYGLSRVMDYFETDENIDSKRIAVFGHSRLGKAALWAGATDQRFAMVISNNSGCGGAALSMRKHGETVEKINTRFPHWFCDNFKKYNNNEESLPVDQHLLLGLIAPRPLYVASAEDDDWADPTGEQLSAFLATEIYRLYGQKTDLKKDKADADSPFNQGSVGYHLRTGKHNITIYDWNQYLDFADLNLFNRLQTTE